MLDRAKLDPILSALSDEALEMAEKMRDAGLSMAKLALEDRSPYWLKKDFVEMLYEVRPLLPAEAYPLQAGEASSPGDFKVGFTQRPGTLTRTDWRVERTRDYAIVQAGDMVFTCMKTAWACGHKRLPADEDCVVCLTVYPGFRARGKTPWKG